jgi:hypothetical protein
MLKEKKYSKEMPWKKNQSVGRSLNEWVVNKLFLQLFFGKTTRLTNIILRDFEIISKNNDRNSLKYHNCKQIRNVTFAEPTSYQTKFKTNSE